MQYVVGEIVTSICDINYSRCTLVLIKSGHIVSTGLSAVSGKAMGIMCDESVLAPNCQVINWSKDNVKRVLIYGKMQVCLPQGVEATMNDLVYVDPTGHLTPIEDGNIIVPNVWWVSNGNQPVIEIDGREVYVPEPDFHLPLTDDLSFKIK